MITKLSETASEYYEKKETLQSKREELADVRAENFGSDSEEIERKARSLFSDVGLADENDRLEKIDELHDDIEALESDLVELKTELQAALVEIRLPFSETIDVREESSEIAFPFTDALPEETIVAIEEVMRSELEESPVELRAEEVAVPTDDISEAIAETEEFVTSIRESAQEKRESSEESEETASASIFG